MKNKTFKKSISLIMTVLMVLSCWVWVPGEHQIEAEAIASNVRGVPAIRGSHYAGSTGAYGTPLFDGNLDRWFKFHNKGSDYVQIYYPSNIYLDKSETLQSAGYFFNVNWAFGSSSDYRILIGANALGDNSQWSGYPDKYYTMTNCFTGYGFDSSVPSGGAKKVYNTTTGGTDYDLRIVGYGHSTQGSDGFSYDGTRHDRYVLYRSYNANPNTATIYLLGTPNGTYDKKEYNTTGSSMGSYGFQQNYKSGWKENNNSMFKQKSYDAANDGCSSYYEGQYAEMQWFVTVYDKSTLNSTINEANNIINNFSYRYTTASLNALKNAVNNNKGVLTTRATTQSNINTAESNIRTAINGLKRVHELTYENLFMISDWAWSDSVASSNSSLGAVKPDLSKGTITVNTTGTEVYSSYSSAANHYSIPVKGNTEYRFEANMKLDAGTKGQMFVFFYDANGNGISGAGYNGGTTTQSHIGIYPTSSGEQGITFTTPANCTKVAFRFGATEKDTTATYSDIRFYETSRQDIVNAAKAQGINRVVYNYDDPIATSTVPSITRSGYTFKNWLVKDVDNDGDGAWDPITMYVDGAYKMQANFAIYSDWIPVDVNYENLFSLADWFNAANGANTNYGGAITADLDAGTLSMECPSGSSSPDNNYVPWNYDITVEKNTDYVFEYDADIEAGGMQVHLFLNQGKDVTGSWGTFPSNAYIYAPTTHGKIEFNSGDYDNINIRFGTVQNVGITNTFSNIRLYKKSRHTDLDFSAWLTEYRINTPSKGSDLFTPSRTGYTFNGWFYDEACTSAVGANDVFTSSTTVYSKWTINTYTITFVDAAGKVVSTQTVEYGETPTAPSNTTANYDTTNHYTYSWPTISAATEIKTYQEIKTPTAHTISSQVTTAATCDKEGVRTYTCSGCSYSYTETISATGHTEVTVAGKAATCTSTGLTEGKKCSVCGAVTVAQQTIEALGHLDTNNDHVCDRGCGVAQGTCSDSGTDSDHVCDYGCGKVIEACSDKTGDGNHKCDVCGKDNVTEHTKGSETRENITEATCGNAGKYDSVYYCTECNTEMERTNDVTIAQKPHNWQEATYSWNADGKSCTATRVCANNAEHIETETVNTTSAQKVAPTCEDKGSTLYTAKFTATWTTEQTNEIYDIPAKGHTPAEAVVENNVPATCTTDGSYDTVIYCSVESCKNQLSRVTTKVSATGHTSGTVVVEKNVEATCTADGSYDNATYCTVCNAETSRETIIVPQKGHTPGAEATCTTAQICTVCNAVLVEALKHDYKSVVTDPTCTTGGYTTHTCIRCDDSYVDTYTDALEHVWSDIYTMESDGKDGKHYQTCTRENCSAKNIAVAHTWNNGVENPEADCENAGTMNYTCTADGCGATYTESVNPDGHSFGEWVDEIPAICNKAGTKGHYECTVCHKYFAEDKTTVIDDLTIEIAPNNHNWIKGETVDPTCTTQGYTNYKCSYCDSEVGKDFVAAKGHTSAAAVIENEVAGTCISEKTWDEVVYCSVCGEKLSTESKTGTIDENKHETTTEYEAVKESCLTVGYTAGTYCNDCDKWISGHEEIPAIAHKDKIHHEKIDATCVATGIIEYWSCPDCGKNFSDEACKTEVTKLTIEIDPDNHDLKTTAKKDPTCTDFGWNEYVTCQREGCGYTTYSKIEATGHNYKVVVTDPTCTEQGYTTYTCACGDTKVEDYVAEKGHAYGDWTFVADGEHKRVCANDESHVETETCVDSSTDDDCLCDKCNELVAHSYGDATCDAPATCTVCGEETGDKLGHDYTVFVETVDYTCTTDGYTVYKCSRCDSTENRDITNAAHRPESDYTVVKKATCEADGYMAILCSECDEELETKTIKKRDHVYKDNGVKDAATCEAEGVMNTICTNAETDTHMACKHESTKVIPMLAHSYTGDYKWDSSAKTHTQQCVNGCKKYGNETACTFDKVVTDPTCYTGGYTTYTCSVCKNSYQADYTKREHIYVYATGNGTEHVVTCKYNNCEYRETENCSGGTAYCNALAVCENCNAAWGSLDKANHASTDTYIKGDKAGNCGVEGYTGDTYHKCCDELKEKGLVIPATGNHSYSFFTHDEGKSTHSKVCSVCGDIVTEDCTASDWIIAINATCMEKGSQYKSCIVCGYEMEREEIPTIAHNYSGDAVYKEDGKHYYQCQNILNTGNKCTEYGDEEACSGGSATCIDKAVCSKCGSEYGSALGHKDENKDHACDNGCDVYQGTHADSDKNHVCDYGCSETIGTCEDKDLDHDCDYGCDTYFGKHEDNDKNHVCDYGCKEVMGKCSDSADDDNHVCDYGCGKVLEECVDDAGDNNHSCDVCGKENISEHNYGEASCNDPATCTECGETTGEALGHVDSDKDHACDRCGAGVGEHKDTNNDHKCEYGCSVAIGTCEDGDKDHTCDYGCGQSYGEHADSDKNHVCDYGCSESIGTCEDNDLDHACDYGCDKVYGTCEDKDLDHACDYGCDKVYGTCEDNDLDHDCDYGCDKVYGTCEDNDLDHACDYGCDKVYGTCEDKDLDHACDYGCDKVYGTCEDENLDHDCDYGCDKVYGTCEDKDLDHACDYGCDKVYGTCEDKDLDHDCDYGCDKVYGTCEDEDLDHACDYGCDKVYGTCEDNDLDHACDYGCDKVYGTCADSDKDHKCDYGCGQLYGEHVDSDKNHVCDYGCSESIGTCEDSDKDHKCDYGCGKNYGTCEDKDLDHACDYGCNIYFGEHKDSADDKDHTCDYGCGAVLEECADGDDNNHSCDICGKEDVSEHVWTAATCTTPKTCSICGKTDGEPTGHNFVGEITTKPTCTEKGVETFTCQNDTSHTYEKDVAPLGHIDDNNNGRCDRCNTLICDHKDQGTHITDDKKETCTEDGYTGDTRCDKCNEITKMGEVIPATGHKDADKDHACDNGCDVYQGTHADNDKNHTCDYGCSETIGTCADSDKDHKCDYGCGKNYGTCEDKDFDHACDYGCDKVYGACEDNDFDHDCDYGCDKVYGTCEDKDFDHDCDYGCDKVYGDCEDKDLDHDCDYGCDTVHGTCEDKDLDHDCDYGCDKVYGTCEDKDLDHACDYGCDKVYGTCEDKDSDHDCDYGCDKVYGTCEDKDFDHDCDYGCDKVYGDCEDKDLDHDCDYGCDTVHGTCEDKDLDHDCDYGCDKVYGTCEDKDLDHDCDYGCDKVYGACEDNDFDHDCDYGCDKVYGACEDKDLDHDCDYGCDKVHGTCEDKDFDHDCDYGCDTYFGKHEDNDKNHVCDYGCKEVMGKCSDSADDKDHTCDYGCGAVLEECADGDDNNHSCDICGKEDVSEHVWTAATCTTPKTCSICGETDGEPTGHNFVGEITTKPTCTEKGIETFTCKNDASHTYEKDVAPLGHIDDNNNGFCDRCDTLICDHKDQGTNVTEYVKATCTEDGYTGDTRCNKCNEITEMGKTIPAIGHKDADKDHACDNGCDVYQGTHADTDKNHTCDYGCSETIGTCADSDKDHKCDYGCDKVHGTCGDADKDHKCDYGCGKNYGTCEDKDLDHNCDYGCDKVYGIHEDSNKDHACDYGCEKSIGECSDSADDEDHVCDYGCGKVLEDCNGVEAVVENNIDPTCTEEGSYDSVVYCKACDKELSREKVIVPALGHSGNKDGGIYIAPSCGKEGLKQKVCEVCGTKYDPQTIAALEHKYSEDGVENAIIVPATCDKPGSKYYVCVLCGFEDLDNATVYGTPTGHYIFVQEGYAATCTEDGLTDYIYCLHVGCEYEQQHATKIPATGHKSDGEGKCKYCGVYMYDGVNSDNCLCHKESGLMRFIYKILIFFWKLFGIKRICACGVKHY